MTQREWQNLFPFCFGRQEEHLALACQHDPQRGAIEAFIHECFAQIHQANVQQYLPELLALHNAQDELRAAVGIRLAKQEPLFLESYLDEPLEEQLSKLGLGVERQDLVEVGNLASRCAGSARSIIVALTWLLAERGLRWVAFTGAATLINSFHRLGLEPRALAMADPARLKGAASDWGRYYEQRPQVFIGNIRQGHERLLRSGIYQRLGFPLGSYLLEQHNAA